MPVFTDALRINGAPPFPGGDGGKFFGVSRSNLKTVSQDTMGTHVSFIFRGYNPYFEGLKPSIFHGFGVQW